MKNKFIIFDETNGKSAKGRVLKLIADNHGIPYFTNSKELKQSLGEQTKCQECGITDCLNVLCHADLYKLRYQWEKEARADQNKKLIERFEKLSNISIHHLVNGNLPKQRLRDFEEGRKTNERAWKKEIKLLLKELAKGEEVKK